MSLIPLLANDRFPTALLSYRNILSVACCVVLAAVIFGGLTDGNGLALAIPLLFFDVFFFALPAG